MRLSSDVNCFCLLQRSGGWRTMSAFCGSSSTGARMSGRAGSCSNERYGSWEGALQILEHPRGREYHIYLQGICDINIRVGGNCYHNILASTCGSRTLASTYRNRAPQVIAVLLSSVRFRVLHYYLFGPPNSYETLFGGLFPFTQLYIYALI